MRVGDKIPAIFQKALLVIIPKLAIHEAVHSVQLVAEVFIDASGQLSVFDHISGPVQMANLNTD
jgi:hypothetical protein